MNIVKYLQNPTSIIIMLIIAFAILALGILLNIYNKKRYQKLEDERRAHAEDETDKMWHEMKDEIKHNFSKNSNINNDDKNDENEEKE